MKKEQLIDLIKLEEVNLRERLKLTDKCWNKLIGRLSTQIYSSSECEDEVVWTFLLALAYLASGAEGGRHLFRNLSGGKADCGKDGTRTWLEALPFPPRDLEGNTNLDLAMGAIRERGKTAGGIEYDEESSAPVLFCEMKWYSDVSKSIRNEQQRNQLARVIENAVTFQANGRYPGKVIVSLVTPRFLLNPKIKSRLYHYKFEEYKENPESLLEEWSVSAESLPFRNGKGWKYPERDFLEKSLRDRLLLHRVSFEELFESAPDEGRFVPAIRDFAKAFNRHTKEDAS